MTANPCQMDVPALGVLSQEEVDRLHRIELSEKIFIAAISGILAGPNCPRQLTVDDPRFVAPADWKEVIRLAANIAWSAPEYLDIGKF